MRVAGRLEGDDMPRPPEFPDWATGPSDPSDIVRPPPARVADGWNPAERPPAQHFNWWQNLVGLWQRWLDEREQDLSGRVVADEWTYPTPKLRTAVFSPFSAFAGRAQISPNEAWYTSVVGLPPNQGYALRSLEDFARLIWPLSDILPFGARVTRLRALVQPGAARAFGDRMALSFYTSTTPFLGAVTYTGPQSERRDNGTTALQVIDTGTFTPVVLAKGGAHLFAQLIAGDSAGTSRDQVHALEVRYLDPGPRNY